MLGKTDLQIYYVHYPTTGQESKNDPLKKEKKTMKKTFNVNPGSGISLVINNNRRTPAPNSQSSLSLLRISRIIFSFPSRFPMIKTSRRRYRCPHCIRTWSAIMTPDKPLEQWNGDTRDCYPCDKYAKCKRHYKCQGQHLWVSKWPTTRVLWRLGRKKEQNKPAFFVANKTVRMPLETL